MADSIATAYVQLVASADGLTSSVSEAMGTAGTKSASSFSSAFGKAAAGAGAVVAGAATAIAGITSSVASAVSETASLGDEIDKTSQKVGVSASDYQALAYAAEHCGFETSTLQTAAKNLASTDFDGNLTDALNTIMALDDADERTALAQELLGNKAAQSMAAFFNGEQTVDDYKTSLEELGGMMSDEAVSSAAAYEDSLTDLNTALSGLSNGMLATFLPGITQVMDGLSSFLSGDEGGLTALSEGVSTFINTASEQLPQFIQLAVSMIESIGQGLIDNAPELISSALILIEDLGSYILEELPLLIQSAAEIIVTLATGIGEALPELIPSIISTVLQIVETLTQPEQISTLLNGVLTLFMGFVEGIISAIPMIVDALPEIISNVITGLIEFLPQLIECGITLFLALIQNLPAIIAGIIKALPKIVSGIVNAFKSPTFKSQMSQAGKDLLAGLKNGIVNFVPNLVNSCKEAMQNVISTVKATFGIHSPSKVFAGIGENLDKGLANGISDNLGLVDSATEDLISAANLENGTINSNVSLASGANNGSIFGGNQIIVNAAAGQSAEQIAELVSQKLAHQYNRAKAAYA